MSPYLWYRWVIPDDDVLRDFIVTKVVIEIAVYL